MSSPLVTRVAYLLEILASIRSHLDPPDVLSIKCWPQNIFTVNGRHIRHLSLHMYILTCSAHDAGTCTQLTSLALLRDSMFLLWSQLTFEDLLELATTGMIKRTRTCLTAVVLPRLYSRISQGLPLVRLKSHCSSGLQSKSFYSWLSSTFSRTSPTLSNGPCPMSYLSTTQIEVQLLELPSREPQVDPRNYISCGRTRRCVIGESDGFVARWKVSVARSLVGPGSLLQKKASCPIVNEWRRSWRNTTLVTVLEEEWT
ncbi:MAG: hypothetical protein J3R72DRAFT_484755 [Linnemannia gamsii]|nr:MAG: hypothetical protein J3R72DRAFT_484755 [Linnemannia gamsii]